jgi:hypothetical protein
MHGRAWQPKISGSHPLHHRSHTFSLKHDFFKSLPPDFFNSFSSLELISSMTRHHCHIRHHATKRRLLHGSSKGRLLRGTTAAWLDDGTAPKGTMATWLLKAPRRCGSSWQRLRGLLQGTGYSTTWAPPRRRLLQGTSYFTAWPDSDVAQ